MLDKEAVMEKKIEELFFTLFNGYLTTGAIPTNKAARVALEAAFSSTDWERARNCVSKIKTKLEALEAQTSVENEGDCCDFCNAEAYLVCESCSYVPDSCTCEFGEGDSCGECGNNFMEQGCSCRFSSVSIDHTDECISNIGEFITAVYEARVLWNLFFVR